MIALDLIDPNRQKVPLVRAHVADTMSGVKRPKKTPNDDDRGATADFGWAHN